MREMNLLIRYAFSILSGVLLHLAFPITGDQTYLAFIAWIPLLIVQDFISKKNYLSSKVFIHSYITFFIYNIGSTWWIWNADKGGAILAFTMNALLMSGFFQFFHALKKRVNFPYNTFLLIPVWISFEYLHYHWELSYPWLNLGNIFSTKTDWIQWYEYSGVLGGSSWILIVNISCFYALINLIKKKKLQASVFGGLTLLFLFIPVYFSKNILSNYKEEINPYKVIVAQPNIDPYHEKFSENVSVTEQLNRLFIEVDKKYDTTVQLVVGPETAISGGFFEEDFKIQEAHTALINQIGKWNKKTDLLIGASTAKFYKNKVSNASRPVDGGPGFIEFYNTALRLNYKDIPQFEHKSKLVLGVEKIPFSSYFPWLEELSIQNGGASGTLGIEPHPKNFDLNGTIISPSICYESIYGSFIAKQCKQGSDAIVIITNDGWWGNTPGYKQHLSFASLRAIENRKSIARSANTGISCFIDQTGKITQKSTWWKPTSLKGSINKNRKTTFYTLNGDLIGRTCLTFTGLLVLLLILAYFKLIKLKLFQE